MFRAFDPVVIRLSLDATNVQREKIVFELVEPFISGFSVEPMEVDDQSSVKRKADEAASIADGETALEIPSTKTKTKKNKKPKK